MCRISTGINFCQGVDFFSWSVGVYLCVIINLILIEVIYWSFRMEKKIIASEKISEKPSAHEEKKKKAPKELGGREGLDPVRFGDWENNGIASDF